MIELKKWEGKNFFKERASKAGALAYQTQINQILRSHMEGKESVDAKTLAQDDRFYPSCGKTCEGIIGKATQSD